MAEVLPAVIVAHAKERRLAPIEKWLTEGNDPDLRDVEQKTLMHYALYHTSYSPASLPLVRLLLANGSDPNNQPFTGADSVGWNVLFYAITTILETQSLELTVMLSRSGARVDVVDVDGESLLVTCVNELKRDFYFNVRQNEAVRLLLSRGAPLLAKDGFGRTAEEYAHRLRNNAYGSRAPGRFDETIRLLRDVRLAGGWKRYANAPRASLLILRELCNRGRAAPPPELKALFCTSSDARPRTRKARRRMPLPTPVFWHVVSFWRSDRDAISLGAFDAV